MSRAGDESVAKHGRGSPFVQLRVPVHSALAFTQARASIDAMLAILLAAQTPAPTPVQDSGPVAGIALPAFDLAGIRPREGDCGEVAVTDDIVVCARLKLNARLPDLQNLEAIYGPKPFDPRVNIAGGVGSARVEQRTLPGATAPALMFDFKLPF